MYQAKKVTGKNQILNLGNNQEPIETIVVMKSKNSKSKLSNTGYKGVCFVKKLGKFKSQIAINRGSRENQITIEIGLFETLREAVKSREEYILNLL